MVVLKAMELKPQIFSVQREITVDGYCLIQAQKEKTAENRLDS